MILVKDETSRLTFSSETNKKVQSWHPAIYLECTQSLEAQRKLQSTADPHLYGTIQLN